ncbi:craniofacial development protein 2-like, partial [Temnothorax curvispinosus]|uniref:Craniofacial development protein 2-like n=1 Tax=Temnothorax curvispinosus TaxID=300111 RepID=A0A6J1RMZ3_9HYME
MTERNKKVDATRGKGISNKLMEVIHEIKKLDMDIVALSETKKKGSGNIAINDYVLIWSGIPKVERAKAGVALLVKRKWVKYIKDIQYVNEQCLVVKIELYGRVASILAVYAPTEDSPEQVKTEFYEELTSLIQNIPNRQQIIVAGDMNARVGSRVGDEVGRYGEVVVNSNRGKLIEFCKQHDLQITNSHFNHKKIHRFTWEKASKSIIDYVNQKIRAEEEDGAMGKIELPKYKTYLLQQDSIRELYERRLNGYLQTNHGSAQGEEMDIENDHEYILKAVHQAAREVMGTVEQQRKPSQGWWSEEMANAVKEKERAYNSWLSHRTAESGTQSTEVWRFLRNLKTNTKNKLNLITLNEQANYYEKLLTETRPQFTSGVVKIEATNS